MTQGPASADDAHTRYFQGLRERRLFAVAESYCLRRLSEPGLAAADRADLTIELSRTLAEHASYRTGQERDELWRHAREVVEQLIDSDPGNPRADQLELQAAIIPALRGASLRWRVELAPHDTHVRDQALLQLQSAVSQLQGIEPRLRERANAVQERTPAELADGALTRAELRNLAREAEYRIAVAWLDLARVLPAGIERTHALNEANTRFVALGRTRGSDEISQISQLYRAEIARRQSDHAAAASLLDSLERQSNAGLEADIAAERVRLELERGRPDQALQLLVDYGDAHGSLSNELAALNVEALLRAWEIATARGDSDLADDLFQKAERMDATVGMPWRARSQSLLEMAADAARYGQELAEVIRSARAAWQNGDVDEATLQYALAITRARESQREPLVNELQLTRASILLQAGRFSEAASGFRSVADSSDDVEQAGNAHLLYAYCLGRQWEQQPTPDGRSAYIAALQEHQERFAAQDSRHEATWMLATVLDSGNEWVEAIASYGQLPADHPRAGQARARTAALFEQQLQFLRETGEQTSDWEDRAVDVLTGFVEHFPVPPARLDTLQSEIAVRLARILLNHRHPQYADADALLKRVQQSYDIAAREAEQNRQTLDGVWDDMSRAATRLQIVALAGQQRTAEARQLLARLNQTGPQELLAILSGLADISQNTSERVRLELADLQIQAADKLMERREELDSTAQRQLDETRAEAYEARRRPHDALIVYEAMLEQKPRDRSLVRKCAELLASTGDPDELRGAYDYWRRLLSLEEQGTRGWLEARYELAACSFELGRVDEAEKLTGATMLLYPELGGADLQQQFAELQARIAGAD